MDYAHAQRVASGLLLRRSQTSHYRQRDGTLSTLRYLHAPLDDFGNPQRAVQVIGPPTIESPVVGVGIGGTEDNQRLVLLCDAGTKDVDFGRLMAAMCFNMDLGDSWEWADEPRYPEKFSALGIRIGVNYVIYAMTH